MNPPRAVRRIRDKPTWSRDKLDQQRNTVLGLAIDATSNSTYRSGLNAWVKFTKQHDFPLEPTANSFSYFSAYMSSFIHPRSVNKYLSGICYLLEPLYPDIRRTRHHPLVSRTMKGCRRLYGTPASRKAPLTKSQLRFARLCHPPQPSYDDCLFLTLLFVGFFALLRLGEMVTPDSVQLRNSRKYSLRSSVEWLPEGFSFWLQCHKTDVLFEGNKVIVPDRTDDLNPRPIIQSYMSQRDQRFLLHPFLWVKSNGQVPSRRWFIKRLRRLFPDPSFAGQSLRSGGATSMAEDGVPPHLIQAAGRWSSDAFHMYIRKHPAVLQAHLHHQ
jgi:hypothetical protein